ncbi:hypothetical protein [Methylogaea oryzae]|uniref:Uncharacterized protein n=1 Tax=Methylogaea oryzae TaxID=1295382 RepID=A0A8D4VKE4_9GAMM|nr:hypothetical protein [Methylogaea oryzae]BBL69728.1 hypothetical protein MoryE10_03340 [Methylogaea oryzae]
MNDRAEAVFWIVWNPEGRNPRFRHTTEPSAIGEAERLAREHPGQMFIVLEAKAARLVDDMIRTTFDDLNIPF